MTNTQNTPLTIFLADDAEDGRLVVSTFLQKSHYRLDMAANGEHTLEPFKQAPYALVRMDVEIFRSWTDMRPGGASGNGRLNKAPIIALTAHAMKGTRATQRHSRL